MGSLIIHTALGACRCVVEMCTIQYREINDRHSGQKRESEVRSWEPGMEKIMCHLGHN